jgi:hypothetical protein
VDIILEIPLAKSYSGIRALADLCVCVNLYQQVFFGAVVGEMVAELTSTWLNIYSFILSFALLFLLAWIPLLSINMLNPRVQAQSHQNL